MRAAALLGGWLAVACVVVLVAVDLPLPARVGICLLIATGGAAAIRGTVLLRGSGAVRGLEWSGGWVASIGPDRTPTPVTLLAGSIRVGGAFLILWMQSSDRIHGVIIDIARQEPRAFRRLCRHLLPSNPKV